MSAIAGTKRSENQNGVLPAADCSLSLLPQFSQIQGYISHWIKANSSHSAGPMHLFSSSRKIHHLGTSHIFSFLFVFEHNILAFQIALIMFDEVYVWCVGSIYVL